MVRMFIKKTSKQEGHCEEHRRCDVAISSKCAGDSHGLLRKPRNDRILVSSRAIHQLVGVQNQGHGAVVDGFYLHIGTELTVLGRIA